MQADKGHLHHRLMESGYGQKRSVIMLYGISATMAMAAVLISRELYKDAAVLIISVMMYLYVFITDPAHRAPSADKNERSNTSETVKNKGRQQS